MKKILSALVAGCMLAFAFVACGETSPEQAWKDALTKNAELTDMQIKADLTMEFSAQGITMPVKIALDSSIQQAKSQTPLSSTQATVSVLGMEIPMNLYTKDGYTYMDSMGAKIKQKADTQTTAALASGMMNGFSVEDLTELKAETQNGKTVLSAKLNGEALMKGALEGTEQILGQENSIYKLGDVTVTATVSKQGHTEKLTLQAPVIFDEQTQSESELSLTVEIVKTGKDVSVELPQDLDSYTEASEDTAGLLGM